MSGFVQADSDRNAVVVPFSDDETVRDDELITEEDKPTDSLEERRTRRQKRQERLQLKLQEGEKAKQELEAERKEKAELRERLARLEGVVIANQNQPRQAPPADGKDAYERELDAIYEEQRSAYQAAQAEVKAGTFTPEREKHYEKVARDLEARKTRVHTRRAMDETEPVRQQTQAQQVWVQKYPEVYQNPRAFQYAQARAQARLALGENITPDVVDEIMTETRTQFKLGAKPAPTQSERSKFSGTPASGSGGGRSEGGLALTRELRQMALAAYDGLPEEEAIKKWTNKTGKRLREKKVL